MNDENGFRALGREKCLALLATASLGRVVYTDRALPAIQPVDFVLDEHGDVIIRAAPGSELDDSLRGAIVAFETDDIDLATATGWSVTVVGRADHVAGGDLERLPLGPWPSEPRGHFIRIATRFITGRRLLAPVHADA
ncbi:pyridoxamine 5'-phosphate oxidase family protein [Actinomadura rugatobispora]|uniref:Pyridoxamine 5'-phosphate oxidase family protein n=1 Tax=Actinomadura rugatobispora TaxID=1994 RepID=A0ABW0ZSF9_9ACTN|nr:pyridoxamine 5'-phosphate oxidase family protein [Actinomadura rugatobispora]